tara:strand:+ start:206 stop:487 length:282 start_codon:yes stop_codon:yes gene_type:complete
MNCITKNERKNTMKNNTIKVSDSYKNYVLETLKTTVKPTLNEKEIYVRLHDGQKAFPRTTNRYAKKGTISHNIGYMSVGRNLLGQFAPLKKVN